MTNELLEQRGSHEAPDRQGVFSALARWSPLVLLLLVIGVSYYAYSTRTMLERKIADVERESLDRASGEIQAIKTDTLSLSSRLQALDDRVGSTAERLEASNNLAANLRGAQDQLRKGVAANSSGLNAARDEATAKVTAVDTKVGAVFADLKNVSTRLDVTRTDVAANRHDFTEANARLSGQIAKNAGDLAELRRLGQHDVFEFEIAKGGGNDVARVEDIRIQLTRADVRDAKYSVVLYANDRQIEKKNLLANEPVPIMVGKDRTRYELVVTSVQRDRIHGYVTVPKERPQTVARTEF